MVARESLVEHRLRATKTKLSCRKIYSRTEDRKKETGLARSLLSQRERRRRRRGLAKK